MSSSVALTPAFGNLSLCLCASGLILHPAIEITDEAEEMLCAPKPKRADVERRQRIARQRLECARLVAAFSFGTGQVGRRGAQVRSKSGDESPTPRLTHSISSRNGVSLVMAAGCRIRVGTRR